MGSLEALVTVSKYSLLQVQRIEFANLMPAS